MSTSSSQGVVKRACDACHRRKVKCIGDGNKPCKNCTASGLSCTYNAVPQKKGPKGSRAKVISELRETQRQSQLASSTRGPDSPTGSQPYIPRPGILSMEMITTCVDYFFANVYPTQPILHRQKVGETIGQMETDIEAYCLMVSLCAYMMIQPNLVVPEDAFEGLEIEHQSSFRVGQILLREAIRVRKALNYVEHHTVWSVITSFFLFGSYFCLDRHNLAWFHLREATTLAQLMGMQEEANYRTSDIVESSRMRRLYWLLFITERAYALQQHRPLTLQATIKLPTLEEDPGETVELSGFIHLVSLFRPFDDTFVGLWNKVKTGATTEWLARVQQQLAEALPGYLQSTETQAVDLRVSHQWLRTMVWQLSISHGFLSSAAADNAMSFKFPIEISRDLVTAAAQFTQEAMEVHGIGLIEKLFDIACTLTDVISVHINSSYSPYEQQQSFEYGPRDYLHQLMTLISSLRGGQQRYMPLLVSKINETMPNAPSYSLSTMAGGASSRASERYGGSEDQRSTAPSTESTPFGSPPLSAVSQPTGFGTFQQELSLGRSPTPASFTHVVMTSSVDYGDMNASAPMQPFPSSGSYRTLGGQPKYEGNG